MSDQSPFMRQASAVFAQFAMPMPSGDATDVESMNRWAAEHQAEMLAWYTDRTRERRRTEALIALLAEQKHLSAEDFTGLALLAGRVWGPWLLTEAYELDLLDDADLPGLVAHAWSDAEYPEQSLGRSQWRSLFHAAGFTIDGVPAERPTEPVRLWRGCQPQHRRRWSWTADLAQARRFAFDGLRGRLVGRVYTLLAPPERILAITHSRQEAEHVVDTKGLPISETNEQP